MPTMGRRRTTNLDLPPRMHLSKGSYFYVTTTVPRKWISLGKDRTAALIEWARIEGDKKPLETGTFEAAWKRYAIEVLPQKAARTQSDNRKEAENLTSVFGKVQLDDITPQHVRQYLDIRGQSARTRANREKALLSHVFNMAREWGYTNAANPCAGVRGHKTPGRDRYVTEAEYQALWNAATQPLRDAMDLALLTGQRPADVLKMRRTDIRDGSLWLKQNKTSKKLRVSIEGELKAVIERCNARAASYPVSSLHLVVTEKGQPLNYWNMRRLFDVARGIAKIDNVQFRDLRAKAASDVQTLEHAQALLGHQNRAMTEHYVRNRAGSKVMPLR